MREVIPIHAHWDSTSGCNFRCAFCLSSSGHLSKGELLTDEAKALLDKLYDAGIVFLRVLGGEPFFRKDIVEILEYAVEKGMILSFSTNASLITEKMAKALSQLRNSIVYAQMSLYGDNEETYEQVTGSVKNYRRALKGLKLMLKWGLDVTILTVATASNCHRLGKHFAVAKKHKVSKFRIAPEIELGRAAVCVDGEVPRSENLRSLKPRFWSTLIEELRKIKRVHAKDDPLVQMNAKPLFGNYLYRLTGIPYYYQNCSAATTMIYIDPTGKASPCPFLNHMPRRLKEMYGHIKSVDIRTRSFQEVWNSKTFRNFREYYDPDRNLFHIRTRCKFYRDGSCVPCVITPCNCIELIRSVTGERKDA